MRHKSFVVKSFLRRVVWGWIFWRRRILLIGLWDLLRAFNIVLLTDAIYLTQKKAVTEPIRLEAFFFQLREFFFRSLSFRFWIFLVLGSGKKKEFPRTLCYKVF
jgi:hypothetical protein